jgi:hypothetical protein
MGHGGDHTGPRSDENRHRSGTRQLTVATGYVGLGLLALTLLIGPANLLLRKRNPVSNYLSRDGGKESASPSGGSCHLLARVRAAPALGNALLHGFIRRVHALTALGALPADVGARLAEAGVRIRSPGHEVRRSQTNPGAVRQQPDVHRFRVLSAQLQAVA